MKLLYYFISVLSIVLCQKAYAQRSAKDFHKFNDCQASSTYTAGVSNNREFDATRALQAGSGYWCSTGFHAEEVEVTWTGYLNYPAQIKGVKIKWAYSPQLVQISVSRDKEDYHVAVPYKRTPSVEASFDEDILFDHSETVRAVAIYMRKPIHDYFGINQVTLIGGGDPLFTLISGITSPAGDMCIQVENGKFQKEGANIVLATCRHALAVGDGRELWKSNDNMQLVSALSNPSKCLVLTEDSRDGAGKLVLSDCVRALEGSNGTSNWTFEANSQLKLSKKGSHCLSQKKLYGDSVAPINIVSTGVTAWSSSNADPQHGADQAINGDKTTYWASKAFEDAGEHLVNFDIDIATQRKLLRIKIDWEYPAFSYIIKLSDDKVNYEQVAKNDANPSDVSSESLEGNSARYLRISLLKPHSKHGRVGGKLVYGIRSVSILVQNLECIVEDCSIAANSDDARDKYFVDYVTEYDPRLAARLSQLEDDVISRSKHINLLVEELTDAMPIMKTCLDEKKEYSTRLQGSKEQQTLLEKKLALLLSQNSLPEPSISTSALGNIATKPAEDCFELGDTAKNKVPGFYWFAPRCAPAPLYAYCDIQSGVLIRLLDGSSTPGEYYENSLKINVVDDIRLSCAEEGLEPLILKSEKQLHAIKNAITLSGFREEKKGMVPLAFDYSCRAGTCSGKYTDFWDGNKDATSLFLNASPLNALEGADTAGLDINTLEVQFFNLNSAIKGAILCSTNTIYGETEMPHIDISCEKTGESEEFTGPADTNFLVECLPGCEEDTSLNVYGSNYVYAAATSICLAGIHAGLIKSGGLLNVSIESGKEEYEGVLQNGIESKPLKKKNNLGLVDIITSRKHPLLEINKAVSENRSIRVGPAPKVCPITLINKKLATSFLQLSNPEKAPNQIEKKGEENEHISEGNNATAKLVMQIVREVDSIHGLDPGIVQAGEQDGRNIIASSRNLVKPAEKYQRSLRNDAAELYTNTENLATKLYERAGEFYHTLGDIANQLKILEEVRDEQNGYNSFKLDYKTMEFHEYFEVHDSFGASKGPSYWGYSEYPVGGRSFSIAQIQPITGKVEAEGTFAFLKKHRFFDAVFNIDFFAKDIGTVGFSFLARDVQNMYLVVFDRAEGSSKLFKIEQGNVQLLNKKEDGGYRENTWTKVKIENTKGRIRVSVVNNYQMLTIFDVIDEQFMSGTIALMNSGVTKGVFFDNLSISAKDCKTQAVNPTIIPSKCSFFKEDYYSAFSKVYEIVQTLNIQSKANWKYSGDIGGRNKVLSISNAIESNGNVGSILLLKSPTACKDGQFIFDFLMQCNGGSIGAIFRYESISDFYSLQLRSDSMKLLNIHGGSTKILNEKKLQVAMNEWYRLELKLEDKLASIKLLDPSGVQTTMESSRLHPATYGQLGFSALRCGGAAFDGISTSPLLETRSANFALRKDSLSQKPWVSCVGTTASAEKKSLCMRMRKTKSQRAVCEKSFCSHCCAYHTSLLPESEAVHCKAHCDYQEHELEL